MISSPPTTASPALPTHTSPTSPSPLLPSCSPPATSMPFPLVDISTSPLPLVDISVDSACHRRPHSPPFTNWKGITQAPAPPPPLCSASSFLPPQKPMSPPRPSCLPLPTHHPSAIPRAPLPVAHKPPPRPSSKPSSPPRPRPQPLAASKGPVAPAQADRWQKPPLPNINILEKLIKTCPVWLQLGTAEERAFRILIKESPGIFIVRRNAGQKLMVLSVRLSDQQGEPKVQELLVKEEKALLYLEGSVLVFDNIFKLIAFYCVSRDILPFTLKLPQAIIQATKYEDMEVISTLGLEFWGSMLNNRCLDDSSKVVASGCSLAGPDHSSSCEIQLSAGGDRLWYVNPIFIEEYCNSLPPSPPAPIFRTQSLNVPVQAPPKYRRPPPLPPPPRPLSESEGASPNPTKEEFTTEGTALPSLSSPLCTVPKQEGSQCLCAEGEGTPVSSADAETAKPAEAQPPPSEVRKQASRNSPRIPPVPLRRRLSDNQASGEETQQDPRKSSASVLAEADREESGSPMASLICLNDSNMAQSERPSGSPGKPKEVEEVVLVDASKMSNGAPAVYTGTEVEKPRTPVPPPRRKRLSQALPTFGQDNNGTLGGASQERPLFASHVPQTAHTPTSMIPSLCIPAGHPKAPDVSLFSPEGGALQPDHDCYSTSSTEEEVDTTTAGALVKRTPTIMLGRAKQRLSMVNFSTVFTSFMCADRKLQKRIVELARDGSTYFGSLVQDYRAFTLETMQRHSSSTEMLQEIRQMMTQLKSYLIQSAELQNLLEPATYSEEKLEIIIEASLCKSVLKPLKELIYNGLRDIHSRTGILKKLKENQQIVLATTTTDLGVTTSVPETPVMEKIQVKLGNLHQEYSPQKKINLLLKTCKMIYESMSVGCPGKTHGADDFLPVLLYVLARCNMTCLVLDVEYMMELMDPALQLGEGSYYLTTTYGALEHIKNYDRQAVTRQLSLEIQDSIHRWERRRTLNKARASRSSVQDFINVSFLEAGSNTKTLGIRPSTTAQDLCTQCAEKFEVLDPDSYCLCVLVDGLYRPLTPEEFPLAIKSCLHHSESRKEYYFVYRHGRWPGQEPDSQTPSTTGQTAILEDSLI